MYLIVIREVLCCDFNVGVFCYMLIGVMPGPGVIYSTSYDLA